MELDEEMESESCGESSDDEVVEELEKEEEKVDNSGRVDDNEEEEEDGGDDDDYGDYIEVNNKRIKFSSEKERKRLTKPATADELNRLRETENLFHSNLFRLQIEEMLKEVQLKAKHRNAFQKWFEKLRTSVLNARDGQTRDLSDASWLKEYKMRIPLPSLPQVEKGTYRFTKPENVDIIGSYALDTVVGPNVVVDVLVELPQRFYSKQDFLNCVYHTKKALYMCDLTVHLRKLSKLVESVNFVADEVDVLRPKLEIIPAGKVGKHVTVVVTLIVHKGKVNLSRFNPTKGNISANWFFGQGLEESEYESPTPFYNSTVLSDLTLRCNFKHLSEILQQHKNIRDGIILFKVWLRQRELASGAGDFSGFLVTMLVSYLLQIRKLNSFMSSYQIVRTMFIYLVSADWTSNGITLCKVTEDGMPTMSEFHQHHKVVFVDTTGFLNLCYGVHPSIFERVRHEAGLALRALDDPNVNSFQILFMTPAPFYRHFDHVIMFHNEQGLETVTEVHSPKMEKLNHCGTVYPQLVNLIHDVLKRGFRNRVKCFCVRQPQKLRWKAEKKFRHALRLAFGLNLDPDGYYASVEKATEGETEEFRRFWGDRSDLRRFQDGTITETVVWNAKLLSEKRLICKQIVSYLMKSKFSLDDADFTYVADQLDVYVGKSLEESALKVIEAFEELSKQLRNLKDLPLAVVSVQGTSPVFRYTEVSPLSCGKLKNDEHYGVVAKKSSTCEMIDVGDLSSWTYINPVRGILQMSATGKWPQDLEAMRRLRAAFYLKIAQSLQNKCNLIAQAFTDKIEVVKDGYVFHLTIFCPVEIGLIKQVVEDGIVKYRDNEESAAVEKDTVFLPKLCSALHGLCEQHTSFGPACCLVKTWINSQMLDPHHVPEEVVELLVASLYLKPSPHEVPQQPQTAFLRFLRMMSATNWNAECVILNINDELNREDMLEIESHFTANRDKLPSVFIATPYDRTSSVWTKNAPTPLILLRLVQLSATALSYVEERIYRKAVLGEELSVLFEPSLDPFNVVIRIHPDHVRRRRMDSEESVVNANLSHIPINGFDPISIYVKELRESYDDVALFFYDAYGGGSVVGVVWKPGATEELKDWKIENAAMRVCDERSGKLKVSKELMIEDFMVLGKGLVQTIDARENGSVKTYTYL